MNMPTVTIWTTTPARKAAAEALRRFPRNLGSLLRHPDYRNFGDTSDDWINDPERMARCDNAAEHGEDGSTHAERLQDMRDNLRVMVRDTGHGTSDRTQEKLDSLAEAIGAEIDACEAWHEANGTLHECIGGGPPEQYDDEPEEEGEEEEEE